MVRLRTEEEYEEITSVTESRIIFEFKNFELWDNNLTDAFNASYWLLYGLKREYLYIEISIEEAYELLTTYINSEYDTAILEIKCTKILNDAVRDKQARFEAAKSYLNHQFGKLATDGQ